MSVDTVITTAGFDIPEKFAKYFQYFPQVLEDIAAQDDQSFDFIIFLETEDQRAQVQGAVDNGSSAVQRMNKEGRCQIKLIPPRAEKIDNLYAGEVRTRDYIESGKYTYALYVDFDERYSDPKYLSTLKSVMNEEDAAIVAANPMAFGKKITKPASLMFPKYKNRVPLRKIDHLDSNSALWCNMLARVSSIPRVSWEDMKDLPKELGAALDWHFAIRNNGKIIYTDETSMGHRFHDSLVDHSHEQSIDVKLAFYLMSCDGVDFDTRTRNRINQLTDIFDVQSMFYNNPTKYADERAMLISVNANRNSFVGKDRPLELWENAHAVDLRYMLDRCQPSIA